MDSTSAGGEAKRPKFVPKVPAQRRGGAAGPSTTPSPAPVSSEGSGRGTGNRSEGKRGSWGEGGRGRGRGRGDMKPESTPSQVAFVGGSGDARARASGQRFPSSRGAVSGAVAGIVKPTPSTEGGGKSRYAALAYEPPEGYPLPDETEGAVWPPGFTGDANPPVALHPFVDVTQSDALANVAEGEIVLIQLPPVTSLSSLCVATSTSGVASPVKPESAPGVSASVVGEDNDTVTVPTIATQPSILQSIPPDVECKLLIRESGRKQLKLGELLFDIEEGVPLTHVLQIAAVQCSSGTMAWLGQATQRIVLQCAVEDQPSLEGAEEAV